MTRPFIIAVDGPAASGKGTLSRRLATAYGLRHLDTGLSYRAVAHALLTADQPLDQEGPALNAAKAVDMAGFDQSVLSAHAIGDAASKVSVFPAVRRVLVEKQRAFAEVPPGAVLDGRDIGTVVCPQADAKLFVLASAAVRAGRRHREILRLGGTAEYDAILADIERRDRRDMDRTDSPLRPAEDAHLLDTSEMSIEAAFLAAKAIVDKAWANRNTA